MIDTFAPVKRQWDHYGYLPILIDSKHLHSQTLDSHFTPSNDAYYEKKPEKPKHDAKTVPRNIEHYRFQETRITGYRLKKAA